MKKFLLPLLLAVAILIPTVQAQAADVPGFYQVGRNYLTFTGREDETGKGYRVYGYDCSVDLNEDFAERYMQALMNNYGFRPIGHFVNDYRNSDSARLYENWVFVYTGSKRVSKFELFNYADLNNPYYCHLNVSRTKDWNSEITHFSIRIAYGLTYGED